MCLTQPQFGSHPNFFFSLSTREWDISNIFCLCEYFWCCLLSDRKKKSQDQSLNGFFGKKQFRENLIQVILSFAPAHMFLCAKIDIFSFSFKYKMFFNFFHPRNSSETMSAIFVFHRRTMEAELSCNPIFVCSFATSLLRLLPWLNSKQIRITSQLLSLSTSDLMSNYDFPSKPFEKQKQRVWKAFRFVFQYTFRRKSFVDFSLHCWFNYWNGSIAGWA